jgi:cytochrome c
MRARACTAIAVGISSLVAIAGSSFAQPGLADPRHGHDLAVRLCANCHVIDGQPSSQMRADVPSFPVIANREGATAERLAGRIIVPHPAMPGVALTAAEIRDIVTYIISLKRNN